jgi:midasin
LESAGCEGINLCEISVSERGRSEQVFRNNTFRLLASMNPATDTGKHDLSNFMRNRYTEISVFESSSKTDIGDIVIDYLDGVKSPLPMKNVVEFYIQAKTKAIYFFNDSEGQKPIYNLRTLCRALKYVRFTTHIYDTLPAFDDGFAITFINQLDPKSKTKLIQILKVLLFCCKNSNVLTKRPLPRPIQEYYLLFDRYWLDIGNIKQFYVDDGKFIISPIIKNHLKDLLRAVILNRYPILLQGHTSTGKTSLVIYLANKTGRTIVRINNHENTDLQEYFGCYNIDEYGRVVFQEGFLVWAVRAGHWLMLDELNLASGEILEALNRLLDDNREILLPEQQEVIKPHPSFILFATQNPPEVYSGRKLLSRAFRNRFIELHLVDIPSEELAVILEKRYKMASIFALKVVEVMTKLQHRRLSTNVFAGKLGFLTQRSFQMG